MSVNSERCMKERLLGHFDQTVNCSLRCTSHKLLIKGVQSDEVVCQNLPPQSCSNAYFSQAPNITQIRRCLSQRSASFHCCILRKYLAFKRQSRAKSACSVVNEGTC